MSAGDSAAPARASASAEPLGAGVPMAARPSAEPLGARPSAEPSSALASAAPARASSTAEPVGAGASAAPLGARASAAPMGADASTTPNPNWMMVEPFLFRGDDAYSLLDEGHTPFRAHSLTSRGDAVTVDLHIRPPPGISRLYVQCPGGPDPKKGSSCDLVAAHGNVILLRFTSNPLPPLKEDERPVYPQEHFVYRASSSLISLQRIPAPLVLTGNREKPMAVQGSLPLHTVGILCRGEDFAIAQLRLSRQREADLCIFFSDGSKWEVKERCPIQFQGYNEWSDLTYWRTDKVVSFKSFLLWADYCGGGILLCEVFEATPTVTYLRLPVCNRNSGCEVRPYQDRHRSLCITQHGEELHFIDVVSENPSHIGPIRPGTAFTVASYTLKTTDTGGFEWVKVFSVRSDELDPLNPLNPLAYPVVSMDEANVVYFLMSEKGLNGIKKVSMVTIDMQAKQITSIGPYIDGVEHSEMIKQKSRILRPFVSSDLPKWLYPTSSSKRRVKKTTKTESRRAKPQQYRVV